MYQRGGSTPQIGFDCSGYVSYAFVQNGKSHYLGFHVKYTAGTKVPFEDLQRGD